MMVMCNDIVIMEYDGRRSGLSNAPLDMEYITLDMEYNYNRDHRGIVSHLNPTTQLPIFAYK